MMNSLFISLAIAAISFSGLSSSAMAAMHGEQIFRYCRVCHTIEVGGVNKFGPNLNGVVGRVAGSVEGYKYSPALHESGLIWDEATLDQWLNHPTKFVKGTSMWFPGLKNSKDRAAVIEYLKSQ